MLAYVVHPPQFDPVEYVNNRMGSGIIFPTMKEAEERLEFWKRFPEQPQVISTISTTEITFQTP